MTTAQMIPFNPESNPIVFAKDGEVFANSRAVAAFFGKQHGHILRDIDNLIDAEPQLGLSNFGDTPYVEPTNGRTYRSYDMDRDGFTLLAMGFTGAKALKWKLRYIEAFNAMEAELRRQGGTSNFSIPATLSEALRLAADQAETIEKQAVAIADMAPKAEFHDAVTEAINSQPIRDVAKVLGTGQNRMFKWLRDTGILMSDNTPYQRFVDEGYFRVVERQYKDKVGESHTYTRTLVTGKGLAYLQKKWGQSQIFSKAA